MSIMDEHNKQAPWAPPTPKTKTPPGVWIAFGSCAALIIGAFLPWVTASTAFGGGVSVNGIDGDGKITAALGAAAAVILLVGLGSRALHACIGAAVLGAIAAVAAFVDYNDAQDRVRTANATSNLVHASVGVGLWLTLAGAVALVVGALHTRMVWKRQSAPPAPLEL